MMEGDWDDLRTQWEGSWISLKLRTAWSPFDSTGEEYNDEASSNSSSSRSSSWHSYPGRRDERRVLICAKTSIINSLHEPVLKSQIAQPAFSVFIERTKPSGTVHRRFFQKK